MPMLGHLWSLAVEEQFYFIWPQVSKRCKTVTMLNLTVLLAATSELLRVGLAVFHVNPYITYKITPTRIDGLCIGAALAIGITLPQVHGFLVVWWKRIAISTSVLLPLVFVALRGSLFEFNVWSQVFAIPTVVILTATMIFAAIESALPLMLARFLGNPVLVWLGWRSYGLYLIHVPIFVVAGRSREQGLLRLAPQGVMVNLGLIALALALSLFLTEVSWRLIESPAQNRGHEWLRDRKDAKGALPEETAITDLAKGE
jgi:peptidoglycan/LPS O-acetylase OafA/YrhL